MFCAFVWEKSLGHAAICVICFQALVCACVCVFVHNESRGGSRREDRRRLIFYPSPACLSQGRLCHQLSACQRRVLLFQSTGELTFLLSLLHLSHNAPGEEKKKKRQERRDALCSLYAFALSSFLCLCPLLTLCLHTSLTLYPLEGEKKMTLFFFILFYLLSS